MELFIYLFIVTFGSKIEIVKRNLFEKRGRFSSMEVDFSF
jgi:hypothetical protein